ncbi:tripartite tricarboxylate transporter substrate binding protein [Rhodococcoides kyotonense]|uniref:Tripartite-type tricarboxylate transporter, receptor component TctC n=1 Tax=Rhodococcoides kyotonense TaxID=398843 RepID=A0A239N3E3_9NOCA|nr:tripartite tricarboxylate transporter substrate binding protein [Rhodococcus kyotonensis]SNT48699.1 Tripartite-type tricarboxylate transporter, receptor component TctC [Rhodococcus kyotonensis]
MKLRRAAVLAAIPLFAISCATTTGGNSGESFPDNVSSIRMIIPFSAGGSTDTVARLVAPRLEEKLGTSVQVLNRPERGGQAGLEEIASAPADGSVIGSVNFPSAVTSYLDPATDVDYDRTSFDPVGAVTTFGSLIVVNSASPYQTLGDLAATSTQGGKALNIAAGAVDDLLPLTGVQDATGVKFNLIPFEGGSSGKVTALLGNKVDVIIAAPSAVLASVTSGDFRVLATIGSERTPTFPDVPTTSELGYDLAQDTINGFGVAAGAPSQVIDAYSAALEEVVADPEFVKAVEGLGFAASFLDPEQQSDAWAEQEEIAKPILDANN